MSTLLNGSGAGGGAVGDEAVDAGVEEDAEEVGIDFLVADAKLEDIERAVGGHGALVGAVRGGKRVVDVADGHHLGLHGNFFGGEAERIAGAVELFVMRASNFRDEAEIAGPGNLHEEVEAVND